MQSGLQLQRGLRVRYALSFYGTLGFVTGFFGARAIAVGSGVTIVHNGIHFHHFWYGLVMVIVTGWLGIAITSDQFGRILASVFGLGVGIIGDEVGLLLTFGDYTSQLTEWFFVGAIATIILITLIWGFRRQLERDVLGVGPDQHLRHAGVFLAVFSSLLFAANNFTPGPIIAGLGVLLFALGVWLERKPNSLRPQP